MELDFFSVSSNVFTIGMSTGVFWTVMMYMSILAIYHFFWLKNPYSSRLFVYGSLSAICFALFDTYILSVHSPIAIDILPSWLSLIGKILLPIGLFFNFKMFTHAIPIKTQDAFSFWSCSKKLYPFLYLLLFSIAILLGFIDNAQWVLRITFSLTVFLTIFCMIIAHFSLKSQQFNKIYHHLLLFLGLLIIPMIATITFIDLNSVPYNTFVIAQIMLCLSVLGYYLVLCRFIINENDYYKEVARYNSGSFYRNIYQAIKYDEFYMQYQPKIGLKDRQVCGMEALIRWEHPTKGQISPADFIAVAEKSDVIDNICRWAIQEVLADIVVFRANGVFEPVSINFSAKNINPEMIEFLTDQLEKYQLPSSSVIIEITETIFLDIDDQQEQAIDLIHLAGIKMSMDDFGAGQSSLRNLDKMGLSEVKLDRELIEDIAITGQSVVIEAIIKMCHTLGMAVVAEGMNDEKTEQILIDIDCEMAQSYSICPPLRCNELLKWMHCQTSEECTISGSLPDTSNNLTQPNPTFKISKCFDMSSLFSRLLISG